ncbi:hypothetical protein BMS3Abin04_00144 [bacterium BMS3Abin04]|nr:hypothetical protein BMS3Abin04_00144 [bacterium BMS3Abin04]
MLPVINTFKENYNLEQLVVIADSGLLTKENIDKLKKKGYEFILGARIKNEKDKIKETLKNKSSDKAGNRILKTRF